MIQITPISTYDYDHFVSICNKNYGTIPLKIIFDIDMIDKENPKCGNCKSIIRYQYGQPKYCQYCGCMLKW